MTRYISRAWRGACLIAGVAALLALAPDLGKNKKKEPGDRENQVKNGQMNNRKMEALLKAFASIEEGRPGFWSVLYEGSPLIIITDEAHNRMRIISPVVESHTLKEEDLIRVMKANFESALDARYAIFNNYLWAVYIHPLAELSGTQFVDALDQVKRLAETYGTSYSSTDVILNAK